MKDNKTTVNGGIGFWGLLQVAFIILKVIGLIDWSWPMVFLPTFISIGICVVIIVVFIVMAIWINNK